MSIDARFRLFHVTNPHVYEQFTKYAFEAIRAGANRLSAKFIFERIRWESLITTGKSGGFKLNNNFTSRYARKFEEDFPLHAGIFETREILTT